MRFALMSVFKLHRRTTVRAESTRQCAIEFDIASTGIASQFTMLRFCFSNVRVGLGFLRLSCLTPLPNVCEHGVEVLLRQFAFQPSFDLLDVSAMRTLQCLFADIEFQVRTTGFAGKDSSCAAVKSLADIIRADFPPNNIQRIIHIAFA